MGFEISVYVAHQHDACLAPVTGTKIQGVQRKRGQWITGWF